MARTIVHRTLTGDMVDLVAFNAYGEETGTTEMLLDRLWDLPDHPPVLPAGLTLELPRVEPKPVRRRLGAVSLWD